jgi:hypothetical protein
MEVTQVILVQQQTLQWIFINQQVTLQQLDL